MSIRNIEQAIAPYQKQLLHHALYTQIRTPEDLRIFMQHHVFAVWDFMSLLKALQNILTNTQTPWFPVGNPEVRYLINEIVLAEETDINQKGQRQSHYEMYLDAMEKSGADTSIIHRFIHAIKSGKDIHSLIQESGLPKSIKNFLQFTFKIIDTKQPHQIAAAFTFGREDLIPGMFQSIIEEVQKNFPEDDLSLFKYYFDRHIELDEDEHGPMALKMIEELCEDDPQKWEEVKKVSIASLQKRIELWDEIQKEILL